MAVTTEKTVKVTVWRNGTMVTEVEFDGSQGAIAFADKMVAAGLTVRIEG